MHSKNAQQKSSEIVRDFFALLQVFAFERKLTFLCACKRKFQYYFGFVFALFVAVVFELAFFEVLTFRARDFNCERRFFALSEFVSLIEKPEKRATTNAAQELLLRNQSLNYVRSFLSFVAANNKEAQIARSVKLLLRKVNISGLEETASAKSEVLRAFKSNPKSQNCKKETR